MKEANGVSSIKFQTLRSRAAHLPFIHKNNKFNDTGPSILMYVSRQAVSWSGAKGNGSHEGEIVKTYGLNLFSKLLSRVRRPVKLMAVFALSQFVYVKISEHYEKRI